MARETRERLLMEASRLFAERGFDAVSVRDVTGAAAANVASVSYYFEGREGLVNTVHEVHLLPVMLEREAWLDGVSTRVSLRLLLEGWVQALVTVAGASSLGSDVFFQLNLAALDHGRQHAGEHARWRSALCRRLDPLVARHLPGIAENTRRWRLQWSLDLLERSLVRGRDLEGFVGRVARRMPLEDLLGRLLDFLEAGLAAPVACAVNEKAPRAKSTKGASELADGQVEFGFF